MLVEAREKSQKESSMRTLDDISKLNSSRLGVGAEEPRENNINNNYCDFDLTAIKATEPNQQQSSSSLIDACNSSKNNNQVKAK